MISELKRKSLPAIAKAVDCQIPTFTPFSSQLTLGCSICQKYALQLLKLALKSVNLYYVLMKLEIEKRQDH